MDCEIVGFVGELPKKTPVETAETEKVEAKPTKKKTTKK